jgi:type IV pilus assembly protein PilM
MAKGIVGLDIGRNTLRAVEVEHADKDRPVVVRVHEVPLPDDAVRSGEVREVQTVATAIKKLWSSGGFKSKDVVIGVGNHRVLARDLTVPRMSMQQIRESLPFQVQEMLPVPVSEALLDFYPISTGESESGPVVNGLLIAAIKSTVLDNVNAVRAAGLVPAQVDLIPFALSRVILRGNFARGTVALIDIGATTTNVVVATAGVPQFVRMIPTGGEDVTRALVGRLEIGQQQADNIKRARGLGTGGVSSEQERTAVEVIRESTTELLNSLRSTLSYFNNAREHEKVQVIVLSGGGSQLAGLAQALGEATRIQVVAADPFATVDLSRSARNVNARERQAMTVALGLAMGSVA